MKQYDFAGVCIVAGLCTMVLAVAVGVVIAAHEATMAARHTSAAVSGTACNSSLPPKTQDRVPEGRP